MIGKNWQYKGLNMSDDLALTNRFVIQEVNKNLGYRNIVRDKQNYHGSDIAPTLASGRLFTFNFTIFGNREERAEGQRLIESVIVPEYNPGKTSGFYTLTWETDEGESVKTQAQVYSGAKYEDMQPGQMFINGSFELFAPDPTYKSIITKTNSGLYGYSGGITLGTTLGVALNTTIAEITVDNTGNWTSGVKIVLSGEIENPKIKNTSNDSYYGLERTTTNLVIDGTGVGFTVEDEGVNVKADRMAGSEILRVYPGVNTFILTGTNFSFDNTITWDIFYNDTYL